MERTGLSDFVGSVVNEDASMPIKTLTGNSKAGDAQAMLVSAAVLTVGIIAVASNAFA